MNKTIRTILAVLTIVFGSGFLSTSAVLAQSTGWITITPDPIFNDIANFLPKDSEFSKITIKNTSDTRSYERIILKGELLSGELAPALELKVDASPWIALNFLLEEDGVLVLLEDTNALPANGGEREFDFTIRFKEEGEEIDNFYQNKSVNFNFIFKFEGELPMPPVIIVVPGGGGGSLPHGLTVRNVDVYDVTKTSAKFSWFTNYNATSRVIACKGTLDNNPCVFNFDDRADDPSLYGYDRTTEEFHTPANSKGVTYRGIQNGIRINEVEITGLIPETTYYYRAISHASPPTVSRTHTFTTLALADVEQVPDPPEEEIKIPIVQGVVDTINDFVGSIMGEETKEEVKEEIKGEVAGIEDEENNDEFIAKDKDKSVDKCEEYPKYLLWIIILLLLIIAVLLYYILRKRREEKNKQNNT